VAHLAALDRRPSLYAAEGYAARSSAIAARPFGDTPYRLIFLEPRERRGGEASFADPIGGKHPNGGHAPPVAGKT